MPALLMYPLPWGKHTKAGTGPAPTFTIPPYTNLPDAPLKLTALLLANQQPVPVTVYRHTVYSFQACR